MVTLMLQLPGQYSTLDIVVSTVLKQQTMHAIISWYEIGIRNKFHTNEIIFLQNKCFYKTGHKILKLFT